MTKTTSKTLYLIGVHKSTFRAGEPAAIVGVKMVTPMTNTGTELEPRICYQVRYEDGQEDYKPVSEVGKSYKLMTLDEILSVGLPEIIY